MSNIKVICTDSDCQGIWERHNELDCLCGETNPLNCSNHLNAMITFYQLLIKEKEYALKCSKDEEVVIQNIVNQYTKDKNDLINYWSDKLQECKFNTILFNKEVERFKNLENDFLKIKKDLDER